jgi:aminoglycoside 6'-N-acetyltransferase I
MAGWICGSLWPDFPSDNERDKHALLSAPDRYLVLVFDDENGKATGFCEASIRSDYVNGTHSSPVAFLEGLYVQPLARNHGIAR